MSEENVEEADTQAKHKQLQKLHDDNVKIEEDLAKRQIGVNPWVILNMRLEMLLNAIFEDSDRYDFEIESAEKVHDILMEIQRQTVGKGPGGLALPKPSPLLLPGG